MILKKPSLVLALCWMSSIAVHADPARSSADLATRPSTAGLRLDGTFIQYQPWMMKMDRAAWQAELQSMQRAGLRTIVVQWLLNDGVSYMPASESDPDPTAIVLDFADRHGMEVWLGLAMDTRWWQQLESDPFLSEFSGKCRGTADRAWARYGRHASLAGWYIPPEPADNLHDPAQISRLRGFLREIGDHCRRLAPGKRVSFAPFLTGEHDPLRVERAYTRLLADAGVDVLMLQDGVGARGWDDQVHSRVRPLFRAIRNACLATGVELWSDVEIFHNRSHDPARLQFVPAAVERLGQQLAAEAPFVSRFIAFDCFHYMSPHRGEPARRLHEEYVRRFVDRPFYPLFGPSVIVDPSFGYYLDRSPESVAAEIRANGYSIVRVIADPSVRVDRRLVEAFHRQGMGVWLQVFGNGTYSKPLLPKESANWHMVTRTELTGGKLTGFQRLCLNHPDYRAWKKQDLATSLRSAPFDGVDIAEPFWPEYPGIESPAYACFCKSCKAAFTEMFLDESDLPDIIHPDSARSPQRNPKLWEKWLQFRQASATAFLDDIVNGPGGLRETSPGVRVSIWSLALAQPDAVRRMREDHGEDGGEIAARVKPDLYCFQTHWPDWTRADLTPDYVKEYVPFIRQLRERSPDLPLMIQGDIGSTREAVRGREWVERFERVCEEVGAPSTCLYEYFIGGWTYYEAPQVATARAIEARIELVLTRRIDPVSAGKPGAVRVNGQPVSDVKVDGSTLLVGRSTVSVTEPLRVELHGLVEDPNRTLIRDIRPASPVDLRVLIPR